jgi:cytochrome c551/c552
MQSLLSVARAGGDESTSLSAAAYFKNVVQDVWLEKPSRPQPFMLSDDTKNACKALIVPSIIESSREFLFSGVFLN